MLEEARRHPLLGTLGLRYLLANMGPLQDIPHVDILKPVCRYARTARVADQVIRELDEAIARAFGRPDTRADIERVVIDLVGFGQAVDHAAGKIDFQKPEDERALFAGFFGARPSGG